MEIRKSEAFDWSHQCPSCSGKGFTDLWDYVYEEHDTEDCQDCEGSGFLSYKGALEKDKDGSNRQN